MVCTGVVSARNATLTPKRLGAGRSLQCGYAHHALSNWLGPAQTYFDVFLQDVSVCKLFPQSRILAHPRIAILGLAGRSKRSMDGLSSFVEHGLHMVPWTWPPGCDVDRSSGSGRPKGRLQSRRVQAQDELESCASDACERLMYQSCARQV